MCRVPPTDLLAVEVSDTLNFQVSNVRGLPAFLAASLSENRGNIQKLDITRSWAIFHPKACAGWGLATTMWQCTYPAFD